MTSDHTHLSGEDKTNMGGKKNINGDKEEENRQDKRRYVKREKQLNFALQMGHIKSDSSISSYTVTALGGKVKHMPQDMDLNDLEFVDQTASEEIEHTGKQADRENLT